VDNQLGADRDHWRGACSGHGAGGDGGGEIDFVTVSEFRAAIAAGFSQLRDAQTLIIDLTGVTFMNSQGLQALIDATQAGPREHRSLRIVADRTGSVRRSIHMTGLGNILRLFDTVDDALRTPS
jgi:anti-sigma B factor antagonist